MVVAVPLVVDPASQQVLWDFSVMKKKANVQLVALTVSRQNHLGSEEGQGQIANRRAKSMQQLSTTVLCRRACVNSLHQQQKTMLGHTSVS